MSDQQTRPKPPSSPTSAGNRKRRTPALVLLVVGLVVVLAVIGVMFAMGRGGSDDTSAPVTTTTTLPPGSPAGATAEDAKFWQFISANDPLATQTPGRDKAVALAKQVCAAVSPSMSAKQAQDAATTVLNSAGVRAEVIPIWAGFSAAAYCPEYSDAFSQKITP